MKNLGNLRSCQYRRQERQVDGHRIYDETFLSVVDLHQPDNRKVGTDTDKLRVYRQYIHLFAGTHNASQLTGTIYVLIVHQNGFLPVRARDRVLPSINSSSPPIGTPRAILVTAMPDGLMASEI